MTVYRVRTTRNLRPLDPLHVGNFYRKERLHREAMQDRQDLILFLANLHRSVWNPGKPRSFTPLQLRLTSLREWVYDFKPALDVFFEVVQQGYSLQDGTNEISTLIPRRLPFELDGQLKLTDFSFDPGPIPDDPLTVISKVYLHEPSRSKRVRIEERLLEGGRADLLPPVRWLFNQNGEFNFYFRPSGKLQQRDTSVWPIAAIETWPSWLREELFGPGIDIDSAYTQFLMQQLRVIYADRFQLLTALYPDLIELISNKVQWRRRLCEETLGLPWNDDNLSLVKTICMSLANGSRISPAILTTGRGFSVTAQIIVESTGDVDEKRITRIGERLQRISRQYAEARRVICTKGLRLQPSRANQKRVFESYFEWEREARYQIWEGIERHGIMVHDGIDGVPERYLGQLPALIQQIGVRLTS